MRSKIERNLKIQWVLRKKSWKTLLSPLYLSVFYEWRKKLVLYFSHLWFLLYRIEEQNIGTKIIMSFGHPLDGTLRINVLQFATVRQPFIVPAVALRVQDPFNCIMSKLINAVLIFLSNLLDLVERFEINQKLQEIVYLFYKIMTFIIYYLWFSNFI